MLEAADWRVITVWECDIKRPSFLKELAMDITKGESAPAAYLNP